MPGISPARMGLPIVRLVIGTNSQRHPDALCDNGRDDDRTGHGGLSPSMDIQVASNFERLLFELKGRNAPRWPAICGRSAKAAPCPPTSRGGRARGQLLSRRTGSMTPQTPTRSPRRTAGRSVIDPHYRGRGCRGAGLKRAGNHDPDDCPGDGAPGEFPEAVERATGSAPPVPAALADIMERREHITGPAQRRSPKSPAFCGVMPGRSAKSGGCMTVELATLATIADRHRPIDHGRHGLARLWVDVGTRHEAPEINGDRAFPRAHGRQGHASGAAPAPSPRKSRRSAAI